jgi:hypothetical protein
MTTVLSKSTVCRLIIWSLVYLIPAYQAMLPVDDPDIWWHLRTGKWIVAHGHVPLEDPFSIFGEGKPWIAYSWLFEVIVYALYKYFGLSGLVAFTVTMSLVVALTIHLLLRRARLPFVVEVILLAAICASLKPLLSPRPWLFTILFTAIELIVILNLRRSWKLIPALLLPMLFVLWANLHIQFVYGLAILAFLVVESIVHRFASSGLLHSDGQALTVTHSFLLLGSCLVATLVNPYHYGVYLAIVEYVMQSGAFQNISELHPMFFRSVADWLVLSLTLTGAFVLGWQRRWSIFYLSLFVMASFFAFRARRDIWFMTIVVAAIVSEFASTEECHDFFDFTKERIVALIVSLFVCLYALSHIRDVSEDSLAKAVELRFPAQAVKFIKSSQLPGPIYNSLDWGGYLIWSLPELPVAVDGRTNLHGDERIASSVATWDGRTAWEKNPELLRARLIIAQAGKPLTYLIRGSPRYRLAYEDNTAVVFVVDGSML